MHCITEKPEKSAFKKLMLSKSLCRHPTKANKRNNNLSLNLRHKKVPKLSVSKLTTKLIMKASPLV